MVVTCCHGSRLYLSLLCALCSEDELLSVLPAVSLSINTQPQVTFLLLCQEFSFLIRDTLLNKKKKKKWHGHLASSRLWDGQIKMKNPSFFFFLLLWRFDQNSEPHNAMQLLKHQLQFNDQNPHNRMQCSHHMLHNSVFGLIVCCQVLIFLFKKMCIPTQVEAADMKLLNLMILNSKAWGGRFDFHITQLLRLSSLFSQLIFQFQQLQAGRSKNMENISCRHCRMFFVFVWRFQTLLS